MNTTHKESLVKIACIQMEPHVGLKAQNVEKTLKLIEQAASNSARLIVLPELCNSGYVFETRDEAFALAEEIPNGATTEAWCEAAAHHGAYLVAGICERAGNSLYNAAVIVGPTGYIGTFRKIHLWNEENNFFEPGNLGFPVFHTPIVVSRVSFVTTVGFRKAIACVR